jgi:NAD-dependent dihydropyrimidine dehydrogenase PreA subunit
LIDFEYIKSLFPEEHWDVGYLDAEQFKRVSLMPVKQKFHVTGSDYSNSIYLRGLFNTIVLIRDGASWDYTHYEQAEGILKENLVDVEWWSSFTNYKQAAIYSGLGVQARNSLVYSYKFGFDCHITCITFPDDIVNTPTHTRHNPRNKVGKLWAKCTDCYDCVNACPANAIHAREGDEPFWLDSHACDDFLAYGDHPTVPSLKTFWHKYVHPEIPKEIVDKMTGLFEAQEISGQVNPLEFNNNGFIYDGYSTRKNGKFVDVPLCRECTSQPRCSKWNGKYPYDEIQKSSEIYIKQLENEENND